MSKIGPQTIEHMTDQVKGLLSDYQKDLHLAYLGMGDDPLTIALSIKVSPDREGNRIETSMNFVTGRIKDKISGSVNEEQMKLFPVKKEWKPRFPLNYKPLPDVGVPRSRFKQVSG